MAMKLSRIDAPPVAPTTIKKRRWEAGVSVCALLPGALALSSDAEAEGFAQPNIEAALPSANPCNTCLRVIAAMMSS
jgi:hypothetical protein